MPMFQLVAAPTFSPTRCCACGSSACRDGFVDLLVEDASLGFDEKTAQPIHDPEIRIPTIGHLWLCAFCVQQAATVIDYVPPARHSDTVDELVAARGTIADLEQRLAEAEARPVQVVSLADAIAASKKAKAAA